MSRSGKLELAWGDGAGAGGDGHYPFRLAISQLEELQEKCDAGPQQIMRRLSDGTWRTYDVRETIRLGLIGGGLEPAKALSLTKRYVDERPLAENVMTAQLVIMAAVVGVPDEPLGKTDGAEDQTSETENQAASSPSPPSTSSAPH